MINTERNRALLTDLFAALGREGWGEVFLAALRDEGDNWAERAAGLGWDALTLFGYRPHRPLPHHGSADLLWAITGGRLLELHRDWAVIDGLDYSTVRFGYDTAEKALQDLQSIAQRESISIDELVVVQTIFPRDIAHSD
jgi:hypothetical protein